MRVLIQAGANLDAASSHGVTALMVACAKGHAEIAKALEQGGDRRGGGEEVLGLRLSKCAPQDVEGRSETVEAVETCLYVFISHRSDGLQTSVTSLFWAVPTQIVNDVLEMGTAKDAAPLLTEDQPRSDAPDASPPASLTEALKAVKPIHLASALLVSSMLAAPPFAGLSYAEVIAKVAEAIASAHASFLDYAQTHPGSFLGLELGVFAALAVLLWLGSWLLAEKMSLFKRTAASRKGALSKVVSYVLGVLALYLYVADVGSDVYVALLLWGTGNYIWASEATFFLVLQYALVHWRVRGWWSKLDRGYERMNDKGEYLNEQGEVRVPRGSPTWESRMGRWSTRTWISWGEAWAWVPGVLALDAIMLAEPFGVLHLLPNTRNGIGHPEGMGSVWRDRLENFLPGYKATRIIVEVVVESTPQTVLQAYIFVRVMNDADKAEHAAIVEYASVLSFSITISLLNLLKVWVEQLFAARMASVPVDASVVQAWEMGAGKLPLDAIRRNTTDHLVYGEEVTMEEWRMLMDALLQNTSLVEVYLHGCGIDDERMGMLADVIGRGALANVEDLDLDDNQIGGVGFTALAKAVGSGAMASLKELALPNNQIGDAGCTALAEAVGSGAMASLEKLWLQDNQISSAAKQQLKAVCEPRGVTGMGFE